MTMQELKESELMKLNFAIVVMRFSDDLAEVEQANKDAIRAKERICRMIMFKHNRP